MNHAKYPEKARRESMFWSIHDCFQQQADYTPIHRYYEVESMGMPVEGDTATDTAGETDANATEMQKAHRLHLFARLVHEGYVDADLRTEFVGGPLNGEEADPDRGTSRSAGKAHTGLGG